ncbi:MAG: hypothetical protein AW11_03126 [Candidatus Accumulibacter regalis]|jgi:hypothetical protein|uniref:Transposase IS701-like DDE domain-containing protein n=2 Tax=Candidatus Accumulibacter TaxID=327159 RepID=A0A011QAT9_ACCRE|nr:MULTISPECIES: transposase [unclassified Candidatus Accumulibacter]EXI86347.1 MAG: hypothetical protein AW11_03126 [Candidatus Accumulibacter regalis]MQM35114.1 hypothetical protein [Candidatus Accumulibacter phosphatis]MBL8369194.1 transposase [Accumulibacter sp.]MBO3703870.1 transposase [Accumulibacter sp.]HRE70291.1 transposase [Accumulibacter sp.]
MSGLAVVPAVTPVNRQTAVGNKPALAGLAVLARDGVTSLLSPEWCAPVAWSHEGYRYDVPEAPDESPERRRQRETARQLVRRSRQNGLPFSFVSVAGGYGHLPWLPHALASEGETFLLERHPDHAVYLDDPTLAVAAARLPMVRASLRLRTSAAPTSLIAWTSVQPAAQWRRLLIADAGEGRCKLRADYLTGRVWVWDGKSPSACCWHLLVCREMDGETLRFCLSNARPDASLRDLAEMRAQAISPNAVATGSRARVNWLW